MIYQASLKVSENPTCGFLLSSDRSFPNDAMSHEFSCFEKDVLTFSQIIPRKVLLAAVYHLVTRCEHFHYCTFPVAYSLLPRAY